MSMDESVAVSENSDGLDDNLEEDQILELLSKLRLEIFQIETTTGPSRRTVCIGNEIKRLESQLAYCRGQPGVHRDEVSRDKL